MTIVILGGGISKEGKLPKRTKIVLNKACEISKKYKDPTFLVCGRYSFLYPKDKLPKTTESRAMKEYLSQFGVPKRKIYIENKSKDTIGNAYYAKKLYFLPRKERKGVIVTSEFRLERVKFIFKKIFGKNYQLKFVTVPSSSRNKKRGKITERQKMLLKKTKEILNKMKPGDHNFLRGKLYKLKYYKEKRPDWVIKFTTEGK